jgi:cell division protein FtsW
MFRPKNTLTPTMGKRFDPILFFGALLFCLFGLLMVFEASNVAAYRTFADKYHFVRDQATWLGIGLIGMVVTALYPYRKYAVLAVPFFTTTLIMLLAVFVPGLGVRALGAHRWIRIGGIGVQPSELAKLSSILYLATWLTTKEKSRFLAFLTLMALMVGLIMLQPDLGTTVLLSCIFLTIYFLSGAPLWHFGVLIPGAFLVFLLLAFTSSYRMARFTTFFNPSADPLGASYHIRQILVSLGAGGLTGLGLGASRQKYLYLPEATTDSIFAIIGEELGFIGTLLLIISYAVFLTRAFRVVIRAPDMFGRLLSGGVFALLGFQIVINIGAMVALFPLTGVPLPFISYGGSNLVISLVSVGILLSVGRHSGAKKGQYEHRVP